MPHEGVSTRSGRPTLPEHAQETGQRTGSFDAPWAIWAFAAMAPVPLRFSLVLVFFLLLLPNGVYIAHAGCNLIPGTEQAFQSTLGATNRPYAGPGESVERRVRPCDPASPGLGANPDNHVVTVVFAPPNGTPNAVVLTAEPNCSSIDPQLSACNGELSGGTATCLSDPDSGLRVVERNGVRYLGLRFPNTDDRLLLADDDITFTGPARIGVTAPGNPLPCGLATSACADQSGLIACIDNYFANDGACGTSVPNQRFTGFTALPPPNDYQADCFREIPPCTASATEVRAAVDAAGNLLMPTAWHGILVRDQGIPVPRLLRARIKAPPPLSFQIPDQVFLGSFTPEGGKLPPIFEPTLDPTAPDPSVVTLFGSTDAPYTTLRAGRRHGTCQGGANAGQRCEQDIDCPAGSCPLSCVGDPGTLCSNDGQCGVNGPCGVLFDFSGAVTNGPIVLGRTVPQLCEEDSSTCTTSGQCSLECVSYAYEAENPVPLEGLAATDDLRSFVTLESIDQVDRNGDGDMVDSVVTLRDRQSGLLQPLDATTGCGLSGTPEGRAVVRINQPPFSYPAVAIEDDLLAFLESESATGDFATDTGCDIDSNGSFFDPILRVFRTGPTELTAGLTLNVEREPIVQGNAVAISDGLVFFRSSETARAQRVTERVNVAFGGGQATGAPTGSPILSPDGRFVAFNSDATNLVSGDSNLVGDTFLFDLETDAMERVSLTDTGLQQTGSDGTRVVGSAGIGMSPDGRFVAFRSFSPNLVPNDTNGGTVQGQETGDDIFVRDRCLSGGVVVGGCTATTERVNVTSAGGELNRVLFLINDVIIPTNYSPAISADGRFAAFNTISATIVETQNAADIFVRDRLNPDTERIDVPNGGGVAQGGGFASGVASSAKLSADGRFVVYQSTHTNLVAGDTNGVTDVFVRDRQLMTNERVSVASDGSEASGGNSFSPSITPDGRYVAFISLADNLVQGDTNGECDYFVHDRETSITERVNVRTDGGQATGQITCGFHPAVMSEDGRFVIFDTAASNLVPGDTNGTTDVFLHDRKTRVTKRLSTSGSGGEATGASELGNSAGNLASGVTAESFAVAFQSDAADLIGGDTNGEFDVFVRRLDPDDPLGVDALFPDGGLDDTVLEVFDSTSSTVETLCPADQVAVAAGRAAFLRPEAEAGTTTTNCPNDGPLNGDGLVDDVVVALWPGSGAVLNLGRAAGKVALSASWVGALVSEDGDGVFYNTDDDQDDLVAQFHSVNDTPGTWSNSQQAADVIEMAGAVGVFITPEVDQDQILNNDGLKDDRVLQVFDAGASSVSNIGQAAEEFVIGDPALTGCGNLQLVAFRTSEAAQNENLNDDITDPFGDTDELDDVLQVYDLVSDTLQNTGQAVRPCRIAECDPRQPYRVQGGKVTFLTFEPDQGIDKDLSGEGSKNDLVLQVYDFCTNVTTAVGAVSDGDPDPLDTPEDSRVFLSEAGRCDLDVTCDPTNDMCEEGAFCEDDTCDLDTGFCRVHESIGCTNDFVCKRCILRQPPTCLAVAAGTTAAVCPAGSTCRPQIIVAATTPADRDDDGVPDEQDNCPRTPNTDQADEDMDGVGDACDAAPFRSTPTPDTPTQTPTDTPTIPPEVTGLSGKKLVVKDKDGNANNRKVVWLSKDPNLNAPAAGSGDDPTGAGASLQIFNPASMETDTYTLPAEGWQGIGKPPGIKGYKYKDKDLTNGPCKKVIVKPGKVMKAVCKGDQINYTLDEPSQGSMAVRLTIGSLRQCTVFDAQTVLKDVRAAQGKPGLFKATGAPAPLSCP
jgi:Tol biopolymer transport system component